MKISYQQLDTHLRNNLLPIYLLSGNEPLLIQEARDTIRSKARAAGFSETERFDANKDFDWQKLVESASELSLFGDKSFVEIKLNNKPNAASAKLFTQFIENINPNKIILISTEKLDSTTQKSNWVTAINKIGVIITIWPIEGSQFKQWVEQRLKQNNLVCDQSAIQFLVHQTEGNLLALSQEIEKLKLLYNKGPINLEQMTSAISDNARYDIFNFIDIILENNHSQITRVLQKLRDEAIEPTLLLWALVREIRSLIHILEDLTNKFSWDEVVKKHRIWDKRQQMTKKTLKQHTQKSLHGLLLHAEKIDHIIKGSLRGNFWDEIELLSFALSGKSILFPQTCRETR